MDNLKTMKVWEETHTRLRLIAALRHESMIETFDHLSREELERLPPPDVSIAAAKKQAVYRNRSTNANLPEMQEFRILTRIYRFHKQFDLYPTEREIQAGIRLPRPVIHQIVYGLIDRQKLSIVDRDSRSPRFQLV